MLSLVGVAAAAAIASAMAVPVVYRWADRSRIVSVPNARSSHVRVTPLGGGIPIAVLSVIGTAVWGLADSAWPGPWWSSYLLGAIAVATVSWFDDVFGAPTAVRLVVHAGAAGLLVVAVVDVAPSPGVALLGAIGVLWVVGMSNAYNFMDGIDGIAAAQAVVAGAGWVWLGQRAGDPLTAAIGALLAGASLGFLVHNWQPARVFMGDVGSAFLGYTFAALTVVAAAASLERAVAGALLMWPFLFDTTFTLLRRVQRRENILLAHRGHLYQRLVGSGWTHARVSVTYAGLALVGVGLAALWLSGVSGARFVVGCGLAVACAGLWMIVARAERSGSS